MSRRGVDDAPRAATAPEALPAGLEPPPRVLVQLPDQAVQGSDVLIYARWEVYRAGEYVPVVPENGTIRVWPASGRPEIYAQGHERINVYDRGLQLRFTATAPGRTEIRVSGSIFTRGITLTLGDTSWLYVRHARLR